MTSYIPDRAHTFAGYALALAIVVMVGGGTCWLMDCAALAVRPALKALDHVGYSEARL